MLRRIFVVMCLVAASAAMAADVCPTLRQQQSSTDTATRIAATACNENMLWYRPFIDTAGRLASTTVAEGESSRLVDGTTEVWRRVAGYWSESGLLSQMSGIRGAADCAYAMAVHDPAPTCRVFLIDNPWSAAFVSYVMKHAGVPGFRASPRHFDYVRDAWLHPDQSPFLYLDPASAQPGAGDLLCAVRNPGRAYGYAGLIAAFGAAGSLNMHCDIVVAVNPDNDGKAYLIGGNVQQGVTMRLLNVNRAGNFWALPQRADVDPTCSPDTESWCNFSRQDWAVLLKLKPAAMLARIPPAEPGSTQLMPMATPSAACCINCVLGAEPPVPRCADPRGP